MRMTDDVCVSELLLAVYPNIDTAFGDEQLCSVIHRKNISRCFAQDEYK